MTTREKIKTVAQERENELCSNYQSFVLGAEYGYNFAIEKAIEWLCANMTDSVYLGANTMRVLRKCDLIEDLKETIKL